MQELRLPWNGKEGLLYGGVIAVITAFLMATINISQTQGRLDAEVMVNVVTSLPFIWLAVMLIMSLVVGRTASYCVSRFTEPTDGFNAKITFNIIFCVLMMSASMSFVGPAIGALLSGGDIAAVVQEWPSRWPSNFFFAFWIEVLIAQPFARYVMKTKHARSIRSEGGVTDA